MEEKELKTDSNEEQVSKNDSSEVDVSSLIVNSNQETIPVMESTKIEKKNKIFQKFKIKDIVFLAIMSACMLLTGAIMPLVGNIPVFGIVQLCLGLQFSLFPTLGMLKVGKPGSLLLMAVFCGVVLVFMNTIMFFCTIICALIAEGICLLIFKNESSNKACLFNGTVWFPLSLPFLYVWYSIIYRVSSDSSVSVQAFIGSNVWVALGMSLAVIVVCFIGSFLGIIINKELKKAGVIKK